jgi:hypothetical protein
LGVVGKSFLLKKSNMFFYFACTTHRDLPILFLLRQIANCRFIRFAVKLELCWYRQYCTIIAEWIVARYGKFSFLSIPAKPPRSPVFYSSVGILVEILFLPVPNTSIRSLQFNYWVVHKFVNFNNLDQTCSNLSQSKRPGVWPKVRGEGQKSKSQSQH